ncbi:hypothetical protein DRH29_03280 [candidate division Kazan bacterium]|uniref:Uncharacterized protein n=1 Tax=candidate division Kazan bacterium TaxID=2202143 RepID=A0A420ZCD4_UNCK3|nr:MAG: hypothetical protein DRH29_03280 [candidate division Kazan bacterium]
MKEGFIRKNLKKLVEIGLRDIERKIGIRIEDEEMIELTAERVYREMVYQIKVSLINEINEKRKGIDRA